MVKKDFISIRDLTAREIENIFSIADSIKRSPQIHTKSLKGKSVGLVFQKPSTRTRISFEVGCWQLGANCLYLGSDVKLGVRESIKDVAKTLSRYLDVIVARMFGHQDILDLAKNATIPVINGLTDLLHPCQVLADLYTIREKKKKLRGLTLAWIGDGNNVCHSLLYGCAKMGINLSIATPKGYQPNAKILKQAGAFALRSKARISLTNVAQEAAEGADIIYTDVWASMGKESEAVTRKRVFKHYQVNSKIMSKAKKNCLFMHCLPAHRGEEVTDQVIDSKRSIVFDQAENRLHVQKAILLLLLR
jgi:ornithine carbamoyltransferase